MVTALVGHDGRSGPCQGPQGAGAGRRVDGRCWTGRRAWAAPRGCIRWQVGAATEHIRFRPPATGFRGLFEVPVQHAREIPDRCSSPTGLVRRRELSLGRPGVSPRPNARRPSIWGIDGCSAEATSRVLLFRGLETALHRPLRGLCGFRRAATRHPGVLPPSPARWGGLASAFVPVRHGPLVYGGATGNHAG